MTIAEQLRREREAAREEARGADVRDRRGIDQLDSLDQLDVLGWEADSWDDAGYAGQVERLRTQTRPVKWIAYTAMTVVMALTLFAGAIGWWYIGRINPQGDPSAPVSFTVEEADTLQTVSERLEEGGFVTDAAVFRFYVEHHGGLQLTPGYYEISQGDHMGNVLARLRTPPHQTYTKVTFPEGYTLAEMAVRLDNTILPLTVGGFDTALVNPALVARLRPAGETSLEGLLFPDTYEVSNAENEGQVIQRMIEQMERVANQTDLDNRAAQLGLTPYEVLIVASLIEEEAKTSGDRPKIARVIYNRLEKGINLEIDAAVRYGTVQAGGDPDEIPFAQQRETPGRWNVYQNPGLPPTPITNPGRASIEAALNPAPNPGRGDPICEGLSADDCRYVFYVLADEEGNHVFAATGEQHQANVDAAAAAGLLD
ncbi:MAG: endolytic transglycosylase MltG [Desertimonas sp.]